MKMLLEQERAAFALAKVQELRHRAENDPQRIDWNDKYAAYVEKLPATILTSGLGQTAATLLAAAKGKEDDPHFQLYHHLSEWLCRPGDETPYAGETDLLTAITRHDQEAYFQAHREALAWLIWLKKLAAAYLKKPEDLGAGGIHDDIATLPRT